MMKRSYGSYSNRIKNWILPVSGLCVQRKWIRASLERGKRSKSSIRSKCHRVIGILAQSQKHVVKLNHTHGFQIYLPAVVWSTRWAVVQICSAIVRISSELVEISSELVEISSELVLRIAELLIISVFRKTLQSVLYPLIPRLGMKRKANPFIFTLIYRFVKSALRTRSREMFPHSKWLEVRRWRQRFAAPQYYPPHTFLLLSRDFCVFSVYDARSR